MAEIRTAHLMTLALSVSGMQAVGWPSTTAKS